MNGILRLWVAGFLVLAPAAAHADYAAAQDASDAGSSAPSVAPPEWSEDDFWAAVKRNDETAAVRVLKDGVARDFAHARCLYAEFLFYGVILPDDGEEPDYGRILDLFAALEFEECLSKPILLALMYREGKGVERDVRAAEHFFRKEVIFFNHLDEGFESAGIGLTQRFDARPDLKRGKAWWENVEQNWPPDKQYELALAYLRGEGVPRDTDVGYRILHRAASKGGAKAREILRQAINQGKTGAYAPGWLAYRLRREVVRGWLETSDYTPKRRFQGRMYLHGLHGEDRQPDLAYIWLYAAEAAGATDVAPALRKLEKELPPEVVQWAQDWVRKGWWP